MATEMEERLVVKRHFQHELDATDGSFKSLIDQDMESQGARAPVLAAVTNSLDAIP